MPASNYYVLAFAVAAAFFFVVWGILDDEGVKAPWQTAGVSACALLCGAVILRGFIIRRAHDRHLRQPSRIRPGSDSGKLSAEKAAALLADITRKSEAAKVLGKVSSGHREVFELCSSYIRLIENELPTVSPGSPRLTTLLKGRNSAAELHKFHTMRWAEIESRSFTAEASSHADLAKRIEAAECAIEVIDHALNAYPTETSLLQSRHVLSELAVSIRVSHAVGEAEKAAFHGDYATARKHYGHALLYLGRENARTAERQRAAKRIAEELEKLPV